MQLQRIAYQSLDQGTWSRFTDGIPIEAGDGLLEPLALRHGNPGARPVDEPEKPLQEEAERPAAAAADDDSPPSAAVGVDAASSRRSHKTLPDSDTASQQVGQVGSEADSFAVVAGAGAEPLAPLHK